MGQSRSWRLHELLVLRQSPVLSHRTPPVDMGGVLPIKPFDLNRADPVVQLPRSLRRSTSRWPLRGETFAGVGGFFL